MIECLICKTSVKNYRGLATHLRVHNINWKVYYDTYMKNPDEGKVKYKYGVDFIKNCKIGG